MPQGVVQTAPPAHLYSQAKKDENFTKTNTPLNVVSHLSALHHKI